MFFMVKYSFIMAFFLFMYSSFVFFLFFYFSVNGLSVLIEWEIVNAVSCDISLVLIFDIISLSFSSVVCFISGCVMMFSSSYMSGDVFLKRFIVLVMLFVLSMNFLVFIPSLPALLLGWDGLGIVSFVLVIYYQNVKSLSAGMLTILMNRIGDVMILICVSALVVEGHWLINLNWDFELLGLVVFCIIIAGMTKSAQFPFSSWLPAAMAAPTPVSALVHSSTLVTAGVFLMIRFYPLLGLAFFFKYYLFFFSILTLLMAGLGANMENDLKKVIALSTLSQLGMMMLSLSLGMVYLSLFHLYVHALFKALLFLCAGSVIHNSLNGQDLRYMGMMFCRAPITVMCMNISNFCLCGMPFLSGFYSKDLILEFCVCEFNNGFLLILVFFSVGMTSAYSLRLSFSSLWGNYKGVSFNLSFKADFNINFSIFMLSLVAVPAGMIFQEVFLDFGFSSFFLPMWLKLMSLIAIFLGLFVSSIFWDEEYEVAVMSSIKVFFSSMWFLSFLSSQPLSSFFLKMSNNLMKSVDYGWLEVLGGQGCLNLISNLSKAGQSVQAKSFNFLVFIMMFLLVGFCLVIWIM